MRSLCSRPLLHVHGVTPPSPLLKPSAHLPLCAASHLPTPTRIAHAAQIRNRHFIERLTCTEKPTNGGDIDGGDTSSDEKDDYVVVNFYRFVHIERPQDEVCKHISFLQKEGPEGWTGNLFVFDSRLSLPPTAYNPSAVPEEPKACPASDETTFATCRICGSHLNEFRHRNCANIDCNLLFLSCSGCVEVYRGCCSSDCMSAPRLRPVLPGHKRYEKWHIYRDRELQKL